MKMTRSSSGYLTEDNIHKLKSHDTKITDYLCSMLNYFSLIPTLTYNLVWYFHFRNVLEEFYKLNIFHSDQIVIKGCKSIYDWGNIIVLCTIISFIKGLLFLLCSKLICGDENDCNVLCLIIKSLTSFIPGIVFIYILPDIFYNYSFVENKNELSSNDYIIIKSLCDKTAKAIYKYYKWEYFYVIFIVFIFCFIPFVAGLMCLKEIWKSRGYYSKSQ
jgi:hypothetical protein